MLTVTLTFKTEINVVIDIIVSCHGTQRTSGSLLTTEKENPADHPLFS